MGNENDHERITLKAKEEAFCIAYAETFSKTEAAVRAGYGRRKDGSINRASAAVRGSKLYQRPEIRARCEQISKNAANEAGATRLFIAQRTKEIVERCMQEIKPELAWKNGKLEETGDFVFDARSSVQALKLLAEMQGMCRPQEMAPDGGGLAIRLQVVDSGEGK